jgi:hypothetical protein
VQFWGKKIDALILFVLYEDFLFVYFTINFLMFFFGGFCCECSTPDYITPDNQNLLNGFDCNKVM